MDSLRVSGSHNSISRNVARGYDGVAIDGSLNRITHNDVRATDGSLEVRGTRNLIRANTVAGFGGGIGVAGSGNVIRDNVAWAENGPALGIAEEPRSDPVRDCRNVWVEGNHTFAGTYAGISLTGCRNTRVEDNTVPSSYGGSGIALHGGSGNLIRQNTVSETTDSGILVGGGSVGTVVKGNLATRAGFSPYEPGDPRTDGIDVGDPGTVIADNRANDNFDYGIQAVSGVIDGGGNTASGNGNPLQCLNVVCES
jgi:parallel beta-helix repeat protein